MKNRIEIYHAAREIARTAGDFILRSYREDRTLAVERKADHDFVTRVDRHSEGIITDMLNTRFPRHRILAEENHGSPSGPGQFLWVVDPLDGTTNFIQKIPHFGISLALLAGGRPVFGLVYDPLRKEMFHAWEGDGAYLNGDKITVSSGKRLEDAIGATGFPFRSRHQLTAYLKAFGEIFSHSRGMRRCGAAVLDLAYLAAGRFDFFWEAYLEPWDFMAGIVLIREAGGIITDFKQEPLTTSPSSVLAANPDIYPRIRSLLETSGIPIS